MIIRDYSLCREEGENEGDSGQGFGAPGGEVSGGEGDDPRNRETDIDKLAPMKRGETCPGTSGRTIAVLKCIELVGMPPKTGSGKIMRRVLRRLRAGEPLGDLSTLEDEASIEGVREAVERLRLQSRPRGSSA